MNGYALIIGINDYDPMPKLSNAVNDAVEVANALENLGFIVNLQIDLSLYDFHLQIDQLNEALKGFEIGLVFFAGHGFQQDGKNYLAGKELRTSTSYMITTEAIDLDKVISIMEGSGLKTKIIILDACRKEFGRGIRGFSSIGFAPQYAPKGTLIAYSTSPGQGAKDGSGDHSYYTAAFLRHIKDENITIEEFFKRVRTTVSTITNGEQTSWEHTSLIGDLKLNSGQLRHSKDLPYSDDVIADSLFKANNSGSEIDLLLIDLGGNFYKQNDALKAIQQMDLLKWTDDELFLMGRGLIGGGENNSKVAIRILENLPSWLINNGKNKMQHILNGMLYEIYFDSKGLIRKSGNKTQYLTEILKLESDKRFAESFTMISDQLKPFQDRLFYVPGPNPKSLPVDLETEEIDGRPSHMSVKSINIHGQAISVESSSDDDDFRRRSVDYNDFLTLLSNELITPRNRITINPANLTDKVLIIPYSYIHNRATRPLFETVSANIPDLSL